jgi:endonuclease/exonuclease/phosphatase family metal-dependent hydrolase
MRASNSLTAAVLLFLFFTPEAFGAEMFRIASFNLENYLDVREGTRPVKSPEARAKVRESILAVRPDVLALQEMGTASALQELHDSLAAAGLSYPFVDQARGSDTNIFVAILSRFPILSRQPRTNDSFLLDGRRFRTSRAFAEVEIQVTPRYRFTLINAHLKSKRASAAADESDLRYEEARLLREMIDAELQGDPNRNLAVVGDFNDVKNSRALKAVTGKGRLGLIDTRPAERNGDDAPNPEAPSAPRRVTWTEYFGREDSYSRIDYILVSRGMSREWLPEETYIPKIPNWGVASDHRPITAAFAAEDR